MGSAPLDRVAVLQDMPPWDKRARGLLIEDWWGAVRVDKTGAASLAVVDPQVPLAKADRTAQRAAEYLDRCRFPVPETAIAAIVVGSAGAGYYLTQQEGAASLPIGILLLLIAACWIPGAWSLVISRHRRLPAGAVTGPLDERTWTVVRYLNSYRYAPAEQRNAIRRLLYGIAQAVATDEPGPDTTAVLAEVHQRFDSWAELPEEQLAELAAALAATQHDP